MNKCINWFESLILREQLIVGFGIPLAILVLSYFVVIEPMQKKRIKIHTRISSAHLQLAEMQKIASSLQLIEKSEDVSEIFGELLASDKNKEGLYSIALDEIQAKNLFIRLAQHGNSLLKRTSDGRWVVWFKS